MSFDNSNYLQSSALEAAKREHIDNLRSKIENLRCKTPEDQDVWLEFDESTQIAKIRLKSGAKNALSGRMISKLTEVIDQVYELCGQKTQVFNPGNTSLKETQQQKSSTFDIITKTKATLKNATAATTTTTSMTKQQPSNDNIRNSKNEPQSSENEQNVRCRGVLIQGFGGTFCSGSDLISARETANQQAGFELAQIMQYNLMRLQLLPVVSCAYIEGYALGGGAELAMGTDFRLMSPEAKVGFVHAKVGVCCGWGGGSRLVELLGPSKALELLSSGRTIDSEQALNLGLSNGSVLNEIEAMDFMTSHTIGSSNTIRALKSMVNNARFKSLCEALSIEGHLFASTWGKEAHLRALQSNIKHNNVNSSSINNNNNHIEKTNTTNRSNNDNTTITATNNINRGSSCIAATSGCGGGNTSCISSSSNNNNGNNSDRNDNK